MVLDGLTEDYKSIADQIEGRDSPPSLTEIHEKLLNHEAKLLSAVVTSPPIPLTANAATYRGNNNNSRNNYRNSHANQNWQPNPRPQHHTPRLYLGKCQLCGVTGHSARRCPQLMQAGSNYNPTQGVSGGSTVSWQPRVNLATAPYNSANWVVDSGATHHLTSDLQNLSFHHPYTGGEDVTIVDGSSLKITHTGSTLLPTSSRPLNLKDVLCVHDVRKNLISVYRMCNNNNVSVQFCPAKFQVKDLSTGARLLQGSTKNELYEWPVNHPITSLFASPSPKTDLYSWHSRLGHPSLPILKAVDTHFSLHVSDSLQTQLPCSNFLINKSHKLPFHSNTISSSQPLEILYSDVWTSPLISVDNFKYYLVIVDHYTRYTCCIL
uniref:Retrovirus-related Pol polyprotein from transposon TNT 1-94 n=1 Tax=Noccaea caerulescens TaxID=107243 RepID=A0A1J3IZM7_NOCCA